MLITIENSVLNVDFPSRSKTPLKITRFTSILHWVVYYHDIELFFLYQALCFNYILFLIQEPKKKKKKRELDSETACSSHFYDPWLLYSMLLLYIQHIVHTHTERLHSFSPHNCVKNTAMASFFPLVYTPQAREPPQNKRQPLWPRNHIHFL